uniref:JmjC domain-containing protein n=1 Tax=Panagrellus redivivus TaxID=6233 RepID=A0A7E4UYR7_PANRE
MPGYASASELAYQEAVKKAKKELRPRSKPEDWNANDYYHTFPPVAGEDNILRMTKPTQEEFDNAVRAKNIPCLMLGIIDDWPARQEWTIERLTKRFPDQKFKVGDKDGGGSIRMKLKYFTRYMYKNMDDSPMNVFDAGFGNRSKVRRLLCDVKPLPYFIPDFYKVSERKKIPPHRWFIIGPRRSGTNIHVDPLGSSAWNALLEGVKLWCLFPPNTPRHILKPKLGITNNPDAAITWFTQVYPLLRKRPYCDIYTPTVCLQRAGEVMYVPSGWWHVVLNTEDTVAITENFIDKFNFEKCIEKCIKSRPSFLRQWINRMYMSYPDFMAKFNGKYDFLREKNGDNTSDSDTSDSDSSDSDSSDSSLEYIPPRKKPMTFFGVLDATS